MEQKLHRLKVDREKLSPDVLEIGTKGTVGFDAIAPEFSSEWNGLEIKAVFHPKRGRPVEVVYSGKPIEIPPEIMRYVGDAGVMFTGFRVTQNGEYPILNSEPGHLIVRHTLGNEGGNSIPDTPGTYEQLVAAMRENVKNSLADALEEAKASGEFDGPPGVGLPGPPGPSGIYMLSAGETLEDVPDGYDAVIDPNDPDEIVIFDRGILAILRTGGDGSPGTVDTYTIYYSDSTSTEYTVYNGKDGKGFAVLGYFLSYDILVSTITNPSPGDAYGIGSEKPYEIFVWDGINGVWKNNGELNGVQGEPGKSVELRVSGGYIQWRNEGGTWKSLLALSELEGRGIVSIDKTSSSDTADTYTITFTDGTETVFQVKNGKNGKDAVVAGTVESDGKDAVSGEAVYAFVQKIIGTFLNGAS